MATELELSYRANASHPLISIPWGAAALVLVSLLAILLGQPLIALALLIAIPLIIVSLVRPHLITPLVVLVLYSNAAVVAVRFHHVPAIVAAMIPATLMIPLAWYLLFKRQRIVITATLPLAVLFILVQVFGLFAARYVKESLDALQTSVIEGLLLYLFVTNVVRTRRDVVLSIWALLLAGSLMGGLSLYQQATGTFAEDYGGFAQVPGLGFHMGEQGGGARQARLCGPIGEQNRYAQIMLMLVPLGLCQLWGERSGWRKTLAIGAAALCAVGCALTFSRGAAVGFALMLVLMTVMRQLQVRQLAGIALGVLLLVLIIPQSVARLTSLGSLLDLAMNRSTSLDEVDGAIRGRATVMLAAVRVTADYPLIGVGAGMFNYYSQEYGNEGGLRALEGTREAHCLYLDLAAEHGIVGLLCFLAMVGVSLVNLVRMRNWWRSRDRRMEYLATGFILALACYLTTGLFLHFSYVRYFWLVLALADATSNVGLIAAKGPVAAIRFPRQEINGERMHSK